MFLRVLRSLTNCFVFGPTLCQTVSSWYRTMVSKFRKYAFSNLNSSKSNYERHQQGTTGHKREMTRCSVRPLELGKGVVHALNDGVVDRRHGLGHRLRPFNNIAGATQRGPDFFMESVTVQRAFEKGICVRGTEDRCKHSGVVSSS